MQKNNIPISEKFDGTKAQQQQLHAGIILCKRFTAYLIGYAWICWRLFCNLSDVHCKNYETYIIIAA